MKIKSAEFVISNSDYQLCPQENYPEYALIGRSNVGKSSIINSLTQRKNLAKTSGKPGKTQLINHFIINKSWFLVDLPGYGYASISKKKREEFRQMINLYLNHRKNLICLFVLIDIRHDALKIDLEFMRSLAENHIPFVIVFTKSDKISQQDIEQNTRQYKKEMLKEWNSLPDMFISSSLKNEGMKEILLFISQCNQKFTTI